MFNKKGLTIAELMVAVMVAMIVIGITLSVMLFAYRTWIRERERMYLRIDLLKATETIKDDIRRSSATYMAFYPDGGDTFTAISMPVAARRTGYYDLNEQGEIEWKKTVIYHVYTDAGGSKILRRTVYDPRDNDMDHGERYTQLESVATAGLGGDGSTTDTDFLENLDSFEIKALPVIVDFYEDNITAQRTGPVTFGWARLAPGEHTVRFEVTGKNENSDNYRVGVDFINIAPCGSRREAEYYNSSFAPEGSIDSNGKNIVIRHANRWGNRNFLLYQATAVGDYIEFTDYFDLWRESSFENSARSNTVIVDEEDGGGTRVKLELPWDRLEGYEETTWFAYAQSGDSQQAGRVGALPGYPITFRTMIAHDFTDSKADLVRVKLRAPSTNPIAVSRAYITRRDDAGDEDGLVNRSTSGLEIKDYHRHQQLFFKDVYDTDSDGDTDDVMQYVYIPAGGEVWSEWSAFPLVLEENGTNYDYLVTLCVPDLAGISFPSECGTFDPAKDDCLYWQDPGAGVHSYYIVGAGYTTVLLPAAGSPVWSGVYSSVTSDSIYTISEIDAWSKTGTIESQIFDAGKDNPSYGQIKWSEISPEGTEVLLKARSSSDKYMDGAAEWDAISGSAANPHSLGIGSQRYVQFLAEVTTDPFWEAPGQILSYADYVDEQLDGSDWEFPVNDGEYLVTGVYSAWIDDVEIRWPGDDRICVVNGYIARKDNYGQARVTVDGRNLLEVLSVSIGVSKEIEVMVIKEESSTEVKPRNTGK